MERGWGPGGAGKRVRRRPQYRLHGRELAKLVLLVSGGTAGRSLAGLGAAGRRQCGTGGCHPLGTRVPPPTARGENGDPITCSPNRLPVPSCSRCLLVPGAASITFWGCGVRRGAGSGLEPPGVSRDGATSPSPPSRGGCCPGAAVFPLFPCSPRLQPGCLAPPGCPQRRGASSPATPVLPDSSCLSARAELLRLFPVPRTPCGARGGSGVAVWGEKKGRDIWEPRCGVSAIPVLGCGMRTEQRAGHPGGEQLGGWLLVGGRSRDRGAPRSWRAPLGCCMAPLGCYMTPLGCHKALEHRCRSYPGSC